jgi:hypothetical protein
MGGLEKSGGLMNGCYLSITDGYPFIKVLKFFSYDLG